MIHKFGHLYGVKDHYDIGDVPSTDEIKITSDNDGYSKYCIYGENKDEASVYNTVTICNGCKSVIMANKDKYNGN